MEEIKKKIKTLVAPLGNLFSRDGRYEMDVDRLVAVGNSIHAALATLMIPWNVSVAVYFASYNTVLPAQRIMNIRKHYFRNYCMIQRERL